MAPGSRWIRCGAGGHRFGCGARRRGRGAVTPTGVGQRAAGGVGRRVRVWRRLAVVWLPFAAATPFLVLSGMAWLITLATLNAAAQLSLPRWVMARGLSVYLLVSTGSQAIGSYAWGAVATRAGLARGVAVFGCGAGRRRPQRRRPSAAADSPGRCSVEVSAAWADTDAGVRTVSARWTSAGSRPLQSVARRTQTEFVEAMSRVRRSRLRTGGHSWRLYHSVEQADLFLERFTVVSWSEFERQRSERWLGYDSENFTKAVDYTVDHTRTDEYYIAKRVHR